MPDFKIYKPYSKDGQALGAASQLELKEREQNGRKEVLMFWTATKQKTVGTNEKDATFDWKSEKNPEGKMVVIKLGDADVGELLSVLNGRYADKIKVGGPSGKGLYHQNTKGNSSLSLEYVPSSDKTKYDANYRVRFSSKVGDEPVFEVRHSITLGEAECIRCILEMYVRIKYGL